MLYESLSFNINKIDYTTREGERLFVPLDLTRQIAIYIAKNQHGCSKIKTLIEDVRRKYFLPRNVSEVIVNQVLGIRNVCANWMNKHATIGQEENEHGVIVPIYNDKIPTSLMTLKSSVLFTCEKYFPLYELIYNVNTFEDLHDEIKFLVDEIVKWSKKDGTGDWNYYVSNVTKGYNYEEIYSQLSFRFD